MMTYAVDTLVRGVTGERGRCRSGSEVLLEPRGRPHISLTHLPSKPPCPCRTSVSFGPRLASKIPHLCVFSTSWGSRRCPGPSTLRRRRWSSRPRSYHGPRKPPNMERMTRISIKFVVKLYKAHIPCGRRPRSCTLAHTFSRCQGGWLWGLAEHFKGGHDRGPHRQHRSRPGPPEHRCAAPAITLPCHKVIIPRRCTFRPTKGPAVPRLQ